MEEVIHLSKMKMGI